MIPAIVFIVFGLGFGIIPAIVYRRRDHGCTFCDQAFVLITLTGFLFAVLGIGMIVTEVRA